MQPFARFILAIQVEKKCLERKKGKIRKCLLQTPKESSHSIGQ